MIVYFCRHANAGKKRSDPRQDEKRGLDTVGVAQCRAVGRVLAALDVGVERVLSSPLKRATQTATLVANEIGFDAKLELHPALRPESEYAAFRELLRECGRQGLEAVLLVGHNPSLSQFLSRLVAGPGHGVPLPLKKGGVAKVETGSGHARYGTLEWLLSPRVAMAFYDASAESERPKIRRK